MSLFPAYSDVPSTSSSFSNKNENQQNSAEEDSSWLNNPSFIEIPHEVLQPKSQESSSDAEGSSINKDDGSLDDEQVVLYEDAADKLKKRKKKKKEKKASKRKHDDSSNDIKDRKLDFDGNEEYYVDKKPNKGYLSVKTLYRPACPKYRALSFLYLGKAHYDRKEKQRPKRYFTKLKADEDADSNLILSNSTGEILSEDEYSTKSKEFNRKISQKLKDIDLWMEYIKHQDYAPIKSTKTQLAERKLEIIERALIHNHGNERLYKLYIDICNATYPSFEVSKMLDILLAKDPTSYVLWSAQILATQGSMARCIVPDVLKLYEECMQKMYRKSQQDDIMIKLFTSCALFLRQSGLNEQFFALIKLALELNLTITESSSDSGNNEKFTKIQPLDTDQQTLIDYEEIVLKSGLPMNEIWLRIEKLRENYNFLPLPLTKITNSNDPQRIVYNEDICYFIYPLSQKENCFILIMVILKLLKIPYLIPSSLCNQFIFKLENLNEFDAVEEILAILLYKSITQINSNFDSILYELIKDTICGPSFLSSNIGYEIYLRTILEILIICADCYRNEGDERRRTIFLLIWLRFERIQIIIEKFTKKLTIDKMKGIKTKIKNVLKKDENRNVLNFYTEYALIEFEFDNLKVSENIFITSIQGSNSSSNNVQNSDLCYAYVTYVEILMKCENYIKALKVLICYALGLSLEELENDDGNLITETRKLMTLKRLTERLNDLISIEKNVKIMEFEQYFLPDYFVNLLKAKTYCQILLNGKLEAIAYIDDILQYFSNKSNPRHLYLREMIYEFYIKVLRIPDKACFISNMLIYETVKTALKEFPDNLFILRQVAELDGQPWYRIRELLTKNQNSPISILFLIASARYRCGKFLESDMNATYSRRVANLLKDIVDKNCPLRKNSLIWRLFLRSLCDMKASFEKCKNHLFTALDECPWNKALYLDGSVVVPQELSQLQDLIIEKQLRMYAIPEELEILRNDTFETPQNVNTENKITDEAKS